MEKLKNAHGVTIGAVYQDKNGRQTIKNVKGKTLGYYDPKTNKTKNTSGGTIGTGNQLSSLLAAG
ncbi:hypothetical protein HWQ46_27015 [Shewanella sp. D64]|uniref:hypothetical protein n=1 Tax=unclassified Shewanella TaxID=196818 RepID=UPI0022BA2C95|nr:MULTISPECIES: hypothetical protein [unclassified Shewanella]MEC4729151.1 hypothetical protein [Shewanella sp. D64]MEC4740941.1 hypothetical protein [Shewanella sp. E94]WBJ93553.1 hypothetical protein HWQ47_16655 [Shewanella sp. MTB7]